ncbi:MAG: hypothetical protein AAGN35_03000 [Bacteroidota bacterium]
MLKTIMIHSPRSGTNNHPEFPVCLDPLARVVGRGSSVAEGIDLIRRFRPQLVFLDMDLPEESAFRLFEETRDLTYDKIVVGEDTKPAMKMLRYHVSDYLLKPACTKDFLCAVERVLFSQRKLRVQQLYDQHFCHHRHLVLSQLLTKVAGHGPRLLEVDDIIRIVDQDDLRWFWMTGGRAIASTTSFARIANALHFNDFFPVGKQLLHLNRVHSVEVTPEGLLYSMEDGWCGNVPIYMERRFLRRMGAPWSELIR